MAINLSDFETGADYDGDYDAALKELQERLARIHYRYIIHRRRAIIMIEGWDAAGKGGLIKRLTADWDPRFYSVWPIGAPSAAEKDHHFLWRFWTRLPAARQIGVFDRSWYGRVLVERVEGYATPAEWQAGFDEINAFEAQQVDQGTPVIKLFLHVTQEEQDKRLAARLDAPEKRWKVTAEDFRNRAKRADYLKAAADMFARTDTVKAPWAVFDANDKKAMRIAALSHIADRLEEAAPLAYPEAEPALVEAAREAFGYAPKV